jgi:hypothetical protein
MAKDSARPQRPLTSARLKVLADLTRAIGEAVVQGDLDRALLLLEERRRAFQGIAWFSEGMQKFEGDLTSLREVDQELLHFCRSWREVLKQRLETFGACHLLQQSYSREAAEARFVDVRK